MKEVLKPLFLLCFFVTDILCVSGQNTKFPTYAIRIQKRIDQIRDTVGPLAGGKEFRDGQVLIDSIIFHYNTQAQVQREQVFRTVLFLADGQVIQKLLPDTSRYFTEYRYDEAGRRRVARHGVIYGSPDPFNPNASQPFPYGGPTYFSFVHQLDTFAFDAHGKQLFYRRYHMWDFTHGQYHLVIKNDGYGYTWEKEYAYDAQNRMVLETFYEWKDNKREIRGFGSNPRFPGVFWYHYQGNSTKPSARIHEETMFDTYRSIDSLFTYDAAGRMVGATSFGYQLEPRKIIYDAPFKIDTVRYLDAHGSNQRKYYGQCEGKKYDADGRLLYVFKGDLSPQANLCEQYGTTPLLLDRVSHYVEDAQGNVLARDSAYHLADFPDGSFHDIGSGSGFVVDSISYHRFVDRSELTDLALESSFANILKIYPNPSGGQITVVGGQSGTFRLLDLNGTGVYEQWVHPNIAQEIDLSGLLPGIYIAELEGCFKKLVIR